MWEVNDGQLAAALWRIKKSVGRLFLFFVLSFKPTGDGAVVHVHVTGEAEVLHHAAVQHGSS